jgi:hypothetical protein
MTNKQKTSSLVQDLTPDATAGAAGDVNPLQVLGNKLDEVAAEQQNQANKSAVWKNRKNEQWFNILRMAGAVTTGSSGTSALFNNKTGGYSIGRKKKKRKEDKK